MHVKCAESLKSPEFELRIAPRGSMEIIMGGESYFLESSFSFPAETIGVNILSEEDLQNLIISAIFLGYLFDNWDFNPSSPLRF